MSTQQIAQQEERYFYEYRPMPDITTYELALIVPILLEMRDGPFRIAMPGLMIDGLRPEARRHFVRYKMEMKR